MATSCEDISARMMELVYGELPDADRASFEAHIAGCARCRAERDAFDNTRAMARGALDEPVPARAHAAILRAASEHLETARAAAKSAAAAPAKTRMSFWEWIRSRWTLPTLATVGAVAVVLIGGKLFLDPKKVHERGERALAPEPAAPMVAPPPAPVSKREIADQPLEGPEGLAGAPTSAAPGGGSVASASKRPVTASKGGRGSAAKPAARHGERDFGDPFAGLDRQRAVDSFGTIGRLGGSGSGAGAIGKGVAAERREFAPPPPPKEEKRAVAADKAAEMPKRRLAEMDEGSPVRPAQGVSSDDLLDGEKADSAPRKPAPVPGTTAAPAPSAPMRPPPAPAAATAPASEAPEPALSKKAKKRSAPMDGEREASATAPAGPREDSKPAVGGKPGGAVPDTFIQRAERLYADGRWSEAAAAYRELLRLDPNNAAAARWRQRLSLAMAQAEAASRETAPASAKPAKAGKAEAAESK